jgi:hypothetical protein
VEEACANPATPDASEDAASLVPREGDLAWVGEPAGQSSQEFDVVRSAAQFKASADLVAGAVVVGVHELFDQGNVRRQDGWALMKHDVPAVMISSSWSDIALVEKFMDTDYHRPGDQIGRGLELGGAADDVEFLTALARWFSDPRKVPFARN